MYNHKSLALLYYSLLIGPHSYSVNSTEHFHQSLFQVDIRATPLHHRVSRLYMWTCKGKLAWWKQQKTEMKQ